MEDKIAFCCAFKGRPDVPVNKNKEFSTIGSNSVYNVYEFSGIVYYPTSFHLFQQHCWCTPTTAGTWSCNEPTNPMAKSTHLACKDLQGYLKTLPSHVLLKLYTHPATCLAVFRYVKKKDFRQYRSHVWGEISDFRPPKQKYIYIDSQCLESHTSGDAAKSKTAFRIYVGAVSLQS